jgi:glycosyltransferase involved in cell wall biosynthesis
MRIHKSGIETKGKLQEAGIHPRMICVIPYFAPLSDSEAFCGSKLAIGLLELGSSLTIFSIDYDGRKPNDNSETWEPLKKHTVKIPPHSNRNRLFSILSAIRYRTFTWARWIGFVVHQGKLLHKERPFSVVYSRSHPMMAHIAAYWLSKSLKIPWIANINDPWDVHLIPNIGKTNGLALNALVSNYWMKKIFMAASLLTFPNARLRDFHSRIARLGPRSEIIPHIGYRTKEHNGMSAPEFLLVHAGKLGAGEITRKYAAVGLLKGLKRFLTTNPSARPITKLLLVGPETIETQSMIEELGLEEVVRSTGRVNYEDSLKYIDAASVCILIEGKMEEGIYLPSKLADYIVARKPVLALSPSVGVIADMLPCQGICREDVDSEEAIESAISRYFAEFTRGSLATLGPPEELCRQFESRNVAERFYRCVLDLLH